MSEKNDLFGKDDGTKSKYAPMVVRAVDLIRDYVAGRIDADDMADKYLDEVMRPMRALDREDGVTIDGNYPMRLVMFGSYNFIDWHKWRMLVRTRKMYPEKFTDPEWGNLYQRICYENRDGEFMKACKDFLSEIESLGNE